MGSTPDVYTTLKEQLKGSGAEVLMPDDGEKYEQSIKRWSEHCEKRAVRALFSFFPIPLPIFALPPKTILPTLKPPRPHSRPDIIQTPPLLTPQTPQACVVKATSPADVSTTLSFIRAHKIPFVVRGGGHSTSGSASIEGGLVIDLSLMRRVSVDPEKRTVRAEGGAIWEDVDVEAAKFGLATVGGTVK